MQFRVGKVVEARKCDDAMFEYEILWLDGGQRVVKSRLRDQLAREGDILVIGLRRRVRSLIHNATTGETLHFASEASWAIFIAIFGFLAMLLSLTFGLVLWVVALGMFVSHLLKHKKRLAWA